MITLFKALAILSALLLTCGTPARAQSSPLSAIERSVAGREPGWQLKRWRITRSNKIALYWWASGKSEVYAAVELLKTPEEAARLFKERPGGWAAEEVGVRALNQSVPGLGDESSLIVYEDTGSRGVAFRKHRVIVRVGASSLEVAERFAAYIAEAIPAA